MDGYISRRFARESAVGAALDRVVDTVTTVAFLVTSALCMGKVASMVFAILLGILLLLRFILRPKGHDGARDALRCTSTIQFMSFAIVLFLMVQSPTST